MSDLIDRQEALDALERSKKTYFDRQVIIGAMKDIVRNLPSAQPETHDKRTETHACDLISREAAIDYFVTNVGFHDEDGYPIEDSDELRKIWTEYFDGIPSAQPDEEKISDALYNIYRNTSPHTSAEGVAATKYYIREIYREIFGEEGPGWMKK